MALIRATGYVIGANTINTNNLKPGIIGEAQLNVSNLTARVVSITYPSGTTANTTVYSSSANVSASGGQTVTINGSGFTTGAAVFVLKTQATTVSVANSTTITFQTPAKAAGRYTVFVVATDGSVATFAPGIVYA